MSILAIVSKVEFEKAVASPTVGALWPVTTYVSGNAGLAPLQQGGDLYLVTVRPGDQLWLAAVLRAPTRDAKGWTAKANVVPILDATALVRKLTFTTGKGIVAGPGKLGMSLQTPRQLTEADVALLESLIAPAGNAARRSGVKAKAANASPVASPPKHDDESDDEPDDVLTDLREHIEDHRAEHKDKLVEFHVSTLAAHADAWAALEKRLGRSLPGDLRRFYQRCDGFTDNRYTCIRGVAKFLAQMQKASAAHGRLKIASIGDGCGLDEKSIDVVLGDAFTNGEPMFVFHDYRMDFDEAAARRFRGRVRPEVREAFDDRFPLWVGGDGEAVDDGDEAELVNYGPVTMTELLAYVLETAQQV